MGAVMSQAGDDGKLHVVAFMSKSLKPAQRNYDVHDRELLAIVYCCQIWRHYLDGKFPVRILTDHKNLEYFKKDKMLSHQQARWSQLLNQISYTLEYKPGTENGKADALSRREELMEETEPKQAETLLRPVNADALVISAATVQPPLRLCGTIPVIGDWFLKALIPAGQEDPVVRDLIKGVKEGTLTNGRYSLSPGGALMYDGLVYVPDAGSLKTELLKRLHDGKTAGHYGRDKTEDLVSRDFYWPGMKMWISQYVATCDKCQRNRRLRAKPVGELAPLKAETEPYQSITRDHITDLPESRGSNAILVIVDRFSKRAHFVPCRKDNDAKVLAQMFLQEWVRLHGFPRQIISDRGTLFTSRFWREFCELSGLEPSYSTAFHPQTDGQTERSNSTLEQYLRTYVNFQQDDWTDLLPMAEFCYNNSKHSAIGMSPFMASKGRDHAVELPMPIAKDLAVESIQEYRERMNNIRESVNVALRQAREDMAKYANRKRTAVPDEGYNVGDMVMLLLAHVNTVRPNKKLEWKTYGPFKITEVVGEGRMARRLELTPGMRRIHPVFHVSLLIPYKPNELPGRVVDPPPEPEVLDTGDLGWVVSEIVHSKELRSTRAGRRTQYYVRFEGYGDEHNEWVSPSDFHHNDVLVLEFHKRHPELPVPGREEYGDA
jgi:transposase InsO family protein